MSQHSRTDDTTNVRLAESDSVTVDMCQCGTLQVHLGALSLRLSPDLVLGLTRTLTVALARRQSILIERGEGEEVGIDWASGKSPRGKA